MQAKQLTHSQPCTCQGSAAAATCFAELCLPPILCFFPTLQVCPYHAWALDGEGVLRDVPVSLLRGLCCGVSRVSGGNMSAGACQ